MKKSLLIGTLFLKVLFDIIILIIIIVLVAYVISSIASLAIFEDLSYIKLLNFIEKAFADCIYKGICEEKIWIEEFYYNPIKYDFYFNFSDGRIYLIRCDEPDGKMYFEHDEEDLFRIYSQNCKILKRSIQILSSNTIIIIENNNKNLSVYTLEYSSDYYSGHYPYAIIIGDISESFEINKTTIRKSLGSFLFGESSEVSKGKVIKRESEEPGTCSNGICKLRSKEDLVEKRLLTVVPFNIFINASKEEIRFIILEI
ncbi:MAG: hypothetical protein QW648_03000 [Nanoarchaeales archaeon]